MKPSRILCIIGLIIGLVMAMMTYSCTVAAEGLGNMTRELNKGQADFTRSMAQISGIDDPSTDSDLNELNEQLDSLSKVLVMARAALIASILVVIIAGTLGIFGPNKPPINIKEKLLGIILFISGVILLPLANYLAAVLYIIAGILYFLDGNKSEQNKEVATQKNGT
jgi:uncharacterized membrane protein YqhA